MTCFLIATLTCLSLISCMDHYKYYIGIMNLSYPIMQCFTYYRSVHTCKTRKVIQVYLELGFWFHSYSQCTNIFGIRVLRPIKLHACIMIMIMNNVEHAWMNSWGFRTGMLQVLSGLGCKKFWYQSGDIVLGAFLHA